MFCEKCGSKIEDGALFCSSCGSKQEVRSGESVQKENVKATMKQSANQKGKLIGVAAIGVIVILAVIFLLTGSKKISVDINEYMTVSFSGYDSCGYVDVDIDKDAIQDLLVEEGIDSSASEYPELDQDDIAKKVAVSIDTDIDLENKALSNGDVITVTITYNEELAEGCNVEFKVKEESFTVSGLEPLVSLNPFEDITVEFTGASPYALPSIVSSTTNEFLKTISSSNYTFSSSSYKIGDVVTVTFKGTEEEANKYGYTLETYTCDYVCEGVNEWIESAEELSDSNIETLKEAAIECIDTYVNSMGSATMTSYEYQGMYVMFSTSSIDNQVVAVYKAAITYDAWLISYEDEIVYFPVCIESIITTPDGEVLYDSYTEILTGYQTGLLRSMSYMDGYVDGFQMYDEIITQNASEYNYVVTDSLVQFGE